jgi:FkbM family methyltransferase
LQHSARSFGDLPHPGQASLLLAEIAAAPCKFSPVTDDAPLALYGAGNMGRLACEVLENVGRKIEMVVDRDPQNLATSPTWCGVPLLHPGEVPADAKTKLRLAVSLVTSPYVAIEQSLLDQGFRDVIPFYDLAEGFRPKHPLGNGWFSPPLTQEDLDQTAKILSSWHDDISRAHHLQFLAWRRLREEWVFGSAPVSSDNRFFIPEVADVLTNSEFFVDGGAHHGHVTLEFVRKTNGAFDRILAIEPDPLNLAQLRTNLRSWMPDDGRVHCSHYALADVEADLPFRVGLGYASQLSETGTTRVATRAIDMMELSPTFLKLHLEGGELIALKGARKTLLRKRPIIAATVYHNADGIWRSPLWLMETLRDYRFLFRLHTWCGTGAVIYAIPNERFGMS